MGKSGHFVHRVVDSTLNVTFGTSYDSTKNIFVELNKVSDGNQKALLRNKKVYSGNIQLIRLKGTVSGGPTQITLKGYEDSGGTKLLIPPSTGILEAAVSGATQSVAFKVDVFHSSNVDDLFFFAKTDTGSFTVTEVQVSWFE